MAQKRRGEKRENEVDEALRSVPARKKKKGREGKKSSVWREFSPRTRPQGEKKKREWRIT